MLYWNSSGLNIDWCCEKTNETSHSDETIPRARSISQSDCECWGSFDSQFERMILYLVLWPILQPFYNGFLQQLEKTSDQMQQYEDERLLSYGRKVIPLETLTEYAINGMRRQQKEQGRDASLRDPCFRDWLLVELTKWFNEKFFTWVNTLPCTVCGDCSDRARSTYVENDIRVEVTMCCNTPTKFPRYNDVVTLLETRKGRCGEYANCFTFFCRCLNYDARLIHGNFDHVWTEVSLPLVGGIGIFINFLSLSGLFSRPEAMDSCRSIGKCDWCTVDVPIRLESGYRLCDCVLARRCTRRNLEVLQRP